ncbi:MAG: hypothetical protein SGILL_007074 [Bacillariaceae sp.]
MAFLLPYSQKLLSLAIYEESKIRVAAFQKKIAEAEKYTETDDLETDTQLKATSHKIATAVSHTKQLSAIRLKVLDDVLRPAILPTERWGQDVEESWRYNTRLVAWLRMQLLLQKYGPFLTEAMVAFPSLRQSPQLQSSTRRRFMMDLMHRGIITLDGKDGSEPGSQNAFQRLPKSDVVNKAFAMQNWAETKDTQKIRQSMVPVAKKLGGNVVVQQEEPKSVVNSPSSESSQLLNHAVIPPDTDLSGTSLEDVLEVVTDGFIANCAALNTLCLEANFYQLWTAEYVQHLGDYLLQRCARDNNTQTTILDVGAGDGLLIQCLREYMTQKSNHKINRKTRGSKKSNTKPSTLPLLVATDNMSWNIFVRAQVEKLSVKDALAKYAGQSKDDGAQRQVIVLCSWMPMGEDWACLFRDAGVEEYILIGESDDGSCGHNWFTWGNATFRDDDVDDESDAGVPTYQRDDYQRWDMDALTPFQFSSFDCAVSKSSKTVSFRRSMSKQ